MILPERKWQIRPKQNLQQIKVIKIELMLVSDVKCGNICGTFRNHFPIFSSWKWNRNGGIGKKNKQKNPKQVLFQNVLAFVGNENIFMDDASSDVRRI